MRRWAAATDPLEIKGLIYSGRDCAMQKLRETRIHGFGPAGLLKPKITQEPTSPRKRTTNGIEIAKTRNLTKSSMTPGM